MALTERLDDLDFVTSSTKIETTSFGVKYMAFRSIDRFDAQTEDFDYGMIHWPGGYLSETGHGKYGFEFEGLFNPALPMNAPSLSELFEYAFENDIAVAITLPTARYQDDPSSLKEGATSFFEELYSGHYGTLPDKLIIELGNEYYSAFDGNSEVEKGIDYTAVVNSYSEVISEVESRFDIDTEQVEYTVQIGKTIEASDAILENLSDEALINTDYLSHHRYPFEARGADSRIEDVSQSMAHFDEALEELGEDGPSLFVSEYNTASLTRGEAAENFLSDHDDPTLTRDTLDLAGRSNLEFEQSYQDQLELRDYGMEQGENLLQLFSEYQGVGANVMTSYGWDSTHAGRQSLEGTDGESYSFIGAETQNMMAEALIGTRVLDWHQDNDFGSGHEEDTAVFGYDSLDKLVIFLTAPEDENTEMIFELPLERLGELHAVWGESLVGEIPENWHELFSIPRVDGVDQSNEAETFMVGNRTGFEPEVSDDGSLIVRFEEPGEIVRLTFARTEEGEDEIEQWHGEASVYLEGIEEVFDEDTIVYGTGDIGLPVTDVDEPEGDIEDETLDSEDGEGGFPFEALLLGLLFPLLMAFGG